MSPAEYVDEIVLPTVRDFAASRRSRRLAYLSCMVVFHIKDHLGKARAHQIEMTVRTTAAEAFNVVRAVCNGTKHVTIDQTHVVTFRAGDDRDRPPMIWGEWEWDLSRWGDELGGREVLTVNGPVDLYQAVVETLRAFTAHFPQHLGACDLGELSGAKTP